MKQLSFISLIIALALSASNLFAQDYELVWEDNFDGTTLDSSIWNIEQRIGVWNNTGGNHELQHYKKENVSVGDDGDGNNCLILTAKREDYNGFAFTSGRVNTKGKFAFRRGKIEAMVKIPDLANGLWPAFWTLGYTKVGWPDCGEIDILEMGHKEGIDSDTVNSFIGSHLFWGPFPRDHGGETITAENLSTGYFKHTVIWDGAYIKTYFNDAATPYFQMGITGSDAEEFRDYMHYIIFNMAVGGSVPGITNNSGITAQLPASLYIDWVKVYQIADSEDYNDSSLAQFGVYGVYEETASDGLYSDIGYDAQLEYSGLVVRGGETPKEGSNCLSYTATADSDFNVSISSSIPKNMTEYSNGSIQFWFKTSSTDSIQVGISDTSGHEAFVTLKDGVDGNPMRNGEWQIAWVQLSDLGSSVDLESISGLLKIKGNFAEDGFFSIDRVIWSEFSYVNPDADYYGIYAEHESIIAELNFAEGGHIYIWNGFNASTSSPYFGSEVISFRANVSTWNGFGIHSDNPIDLSPYYDGAIHFSYKTSGTADIEIGMKNSSDKGWKKVFVGSTQLKRDGKWHEYKINLKDFVFDDGSFNADNFKEITIPLYMVGTADIAFDEIYFSKDGTALDYPEIPSGTDVTNMNDHLSVFPNPVNNILNISSIDQNTEVEIIDQLGRVVIKVTLNGTGSLDVSTLTSGFYSVRINNQSNISIFQIVKN